MKCEKCNEKDANFHYKSTINGKTTEHHMCAECASESGLDREFNWKPESLNSFWGSPFGLFDDFFGSRRSLFPSLNFGTGLMVPVLTMPRIDISWDDAPAGATSTEAAPEKHASSIPEDAGEEIKAMRELTALKGKLDAAIKAENFEEAIILRDKIKELEKK